MNLNPITALSDQLQKLINERGSAAILRDHLALFKDKILLLEQKAATLESENAILKTENAQFKSDVQNRRIANNELAAKIKEYENSSHKDLLDEAKTKILIFLSKQQSTVMIPQIVHAINLSQQATVFHVTELLNMNKLQQFSSVMGGPSLYSIAQEGRRYLIERNLL